MSYLPGAAARSAFVLTSCRRRSAREDARTGLSKTDVLAGLIEEAAKLSRKGSRR